MYVEDKWRLKVWRRLPQQLADSRRQAVYESWATFRSALYPTPLVCTNYNHGVELSTLARHRFTIARTFAAHALWIYAHCRTLNGWFTSILQAHGSFQEQLEYTLSFSAFRINFQLNDVLFESNLLNRLSSRSYSCILSYLECHEWSLQNF